MIILTQITNSYVGMVLAMLYGIFASLALPLETIMLPIYAGDLFGDKSFDRVLVDIERYPLQHKHSHASLYNDKYTSCS